MVFLRGEINKKSNQDTPDFFLSAVSLVVNSMRFCHANQNKRNLTEIAMKPRVLKQVSLNMFLCNCIA